MARSTCLYISITIAGVQKIIFFLVLLCSLLTGCSAEYAAQYQSVNTESKWDESGRISINGAKQELPLYKVKDNKLYLMIQSTRSEWFFRTVVNYPSWDKPEMRKLVENHSETKPLVPVDWNNWLPKGYGDECIPGLNR